MQRPNPFIEGKRERINKAARIILKMIPAKRDKVEGTLEVSLGISKRKAHEYLLTMMAVHDLEFKDGNVIKPES